MILSDLKVWGDAEVERLAFERLNTINLAVSESRAYLAFPWTTLFKAMESNSSIELELTESLNQLKQKTKEYKNIATVCQHLGAFRYRRLFESVGVTHLFITDVSPRVINQKFRIEVHPFPHHDSFSSALNENRKNELSIFDQAKCVKGVVDRIHSDFGVDIFVPCGWTVDMPLSAIWSIIAKGFIPVLPKGQFFLPGNPKLWHAALYLVDSQQFKSEILYYSLFDIVKDKKKLDAKIQAIQQLNFAYGKELLVTDLLTFFVSPDDLRQRQQILTNSLRSLVDGGLPDKLVLIGFLSRLLIDYDTTYNETQHDVYLRESIISMLKKREFSDISRDIFNVVEPKGWFLR
ncbi:hypothetical protein [Neptunomonas phycophila]|uniref:hypothetical protein n=1 Tax=Neptunomonas phycophila TaxID=1572645 RepID=UPI0015B90BB8|nr:hypothetical protein [Neptunomonas phycophila]QLE96780.1 hypothetical protein FLM49_03655 [Neptunomonas phycophila]